ncbi:GNAT family N-acetyltransferase [Streptomyces sp. NPDC054796]
MRPTVPPVGPAHGAARVRHIAAGDWEEIVALESGAYAGLGLSEGREALRSRADASPATCFVLEAGARLAGYVLALPYPAFRYPDLDRPEDASFSSGSAGPSGSATSSGNLHLHDMVIAEDLRRRGLARHLLRHLVLSARALGYERISLVAVGCSERFWAARGFTAHSGVLSSDGYGPDAVYMSRPLAALPDGAPEPVGAAVAPRGIPVRDEVS